MPVVAADVVGDDAEVLGPIVGMAALPVRAQPDRVIEDVLLDALLGRAQAPQQRRLGCPVVGLDLLPAAAWHDWRESLRSPGR